MLDSVYNACMPASRDHDESITSVDDHRLLVAGTVSTANERLGASDFPGQFLIGVVRAPNGSRQGKSRANLARLGREIETSVLGFDGWAIVQERVDLFGRRPAAGFLVKDGRWTKIVGPSLPTAPRTDRTPPE
jgi:hypothetical protein